MTEPLLEISDLRKSFGSTQVLAGVSLAVSQGDIVSILGPSGSGKSTIFNILTGAVQPDAGSISFAATHLQNHDRPFALMPQGDALLPWRRTVENAAIGLEVMGEPRRRARARAAALFEDFGLAGTERAWPRQLSGGMRQRVSFLRTVVQERPVLLLDEPFGALDAITRESLQLWLLEMWAQAGWTIVMITHDIREAVRLSDRVYVLTQKPARFLGHVDIPRSIARGEGFYHDPRRPEAEERLHELLLQAGALENSLAGGS